MSENPSVPEFFTVPLNVPSAESEKPKISPVAFVTTPLNVPLAVPEKETAPPALLIKSCANVPLAVPKKPKIPEFLTVPLKVPSAESEKPKIPPVAFVTAPLNVPLAVPAKETAPPALLVKSCANVPPAVSENPSLPEFFTVLLKIPSAESLNSAEPEFVTAPPKLILIPPENSAVLEISRFFTFILIFPVEKIAFPALSVPSPVKVTVARESFNSIEETSRTVPVPTSILYVQETPGAAAKDIFPETFKVPPPVSAKSTEGTSADELPRTRVFALRSAPDKFIVIFSVPTEEPAA